MAEFGAAGAGRRDEDRRALKEGKKLLKKALGAAGMGGLLGKGKSKEKLRREKQRRRDEEQARVAAETRARQNAAREAMVRRCAAAERAKHSRARDEERAAAQRAREEDLARLEAEAAEREAAGRAAVAAARAEAESDFKSVAAERALADRATEALEAERAASQARAQREAETERRCQATERALDGAQRKEQALREQIRTKEWDLAEAERERARWYADSAQARSTAEAQRSRAEFYVTEAQRRDAPGDNENHRARHLEAELERVKRERDLERERASRQARLTETQLRFAEAELGRTRDAQQNDDTARAAAARAAAARAAAGPKARQAELTRALFAQNPGWAEMFRRPPGHWKCDACWVWNDTEATACVACETPKPGAAPPPSEPFYGLHTFSVGTSAPTVTWRSKNGRRIVKAKRPPRAGGRTLHTPTEQARSTAEAQRSSAEEMQKLKLQAAAWRNVEAAQQEVQKARMAIPQPSKDVCLLYSQDFGKAERKRWNDASYNLAAARAAAEASSQEGDVDPDLYARLQNQHEEYNRTRNRTRGPRRGRGGRR